MVVGAGKKSRRRPAARASKSAANVVDEDDDATTTGTKRKAGPGHAKASAGKVQTLSRVLLQQVLTIPGARG